MKMLALTIRFLLELAALAALAYSGVAGIGGPAGWLAGIAFAALAATAWGLFVAPRARIAASTPVRLTVEISVFLAACIGLLLAHRPWLAAILGAVYVLDRLALLASGAPPFEPAA